MQFMHWNASVSTKASRHPTHFLCSLRIMQATYLGCLLLSSIFCISNIGGALSYWTHSLNHHSMLLHCLLCLEMNSITWPLRCWVRNNVCILSGCTNTEDLFSLSVAWPTKDWGRESPQDNFPWASAPFISGLSQSPWFLNLSIPLS